MLLTIYLIFDKQQYTRITKQHKYKRKKIKNMNMKKSKKTN